MNTVWSDHIQGIDTLFTSRALRFATMVFLAVGTGKLYKNALAVISTTQAHTQLVWQQAS